MKLIFPLSIALAGEPAAEPKVPAPETEQQTTVEQAVQMNEKLSEILARVETLKPETDTNALVESEPIKRVEGLVETK